MKTTTIFILFAIVTLLFYMSACKPNASSSQVKIATETKDSTTLQISADSLDALVHSIVAISANDFYNNQQPVPVAFRDVQLKYYFKANNELLYILCGEFSAHGEGDNAEWTHFTTIKNSDYEQWIGANGLTYCDNAKEIQNINVDLAKQLKSRLDALSSKVK